MMGEYGYIYANHWKQKLCDKELIIKNLNNPETSATFQVLFNPEPRIGRKLNKKEIHDMLGGYKIDEVIENLNK